jgi:hypothetical protein
MEVEKKIEKQLEIYDELAKNDKKIDIGALMLDALSNQERSMVSSREKKWAYLVSIGLPPLGFLFALKLYFTNKDDSRHVANICVVLTIISLLVAWFFGKMMFSSANITDNQINQIKELKPTDIEQLLN